MWVHYLASHGNRRGYYQGCPHSPHSEWQSIMPLCGWYQWWCVQDRAGYWCPLACMRKCMERKNQHQHVCHRHWNHWPSCRWRFHRCTEESCGTACAGTCPEICRTSWECFEACRSHTRMITQGHTLGWQEQIKKGWCGKDILQRLCNIWGLQKFIIYQTKKTYGQQIHKSDAGCNQRNLICTSLFWSHRWSTTHRARNKGIDWGVICKILGKDPTEKVGISYLLILPQTLLIPSRMAWNGHFLICR